MLSQFVGACLLALAPVQLEVPAHQGWVTDLGELLTPDQERALSGLMESYRAGSGHEIALLTLPSLEGDSLEGFTLRVAEAWGLGGAERDEGALLLVSRDDRRMRIEVGYGLEGNLPDVICGRILSDVIAPRFRSGDWYGGIHSGVQAIHAAAGGDYGPIRQSRSARRRSAGGFAILPMLVFLVLMGVLGRRRRVVGGGAGDVVGGVLPWMVMSSMINGRHQSGGGFGGGSGLGGGGFGGFSGGGGFGGGGASGGW